MKRNTLLVLAYAILFSMAAVSFSLYHTTVPVNTAIVGSKVFDISRTTTVNDAQYLENTPSWMFMVFNTAAISGSDYYDTKVKVELPPSTITTGLLVGIYDINHLQLAASYFTNGTANLIVPRQFKMDADSKISLFLEYYYLGQAISADIIPFAPVSVKASVTVWGSISPNDDQIITGVLDNRWCSAYLTAINGNKTNVSGYVKVPAPGILKGPKEYKNSRTGTITIEFVKTTGTLTIRRSDSAATTPGDLSCEFVNIDTSAYINPNTVVIQNENTSSNQYFRITNLKLNGIVYAGPYLDNLTKQKELFRNFQTNADGSFSASFDYTSDGSITDFSINFGYAQ